MIHRFFQRDKKKPISRSALFNVVRSPIVTEKSTIKTGEGQYFFKVASWANKIQIQKAIELIFSVKVESVNTLNLKGKTKRFRGRQGQCQDYKKAMVRLEKGQSIELEGHFSEGGGV